MHSPCISQYMLSCFFSQKGKTLISMSEHMYPSQNAESSLSLSREFVESFWTLAHYDQSLCCPQINAFAVLSLECIYFCELFPSTRLFSLSPNHKERRGKP